MKSAYNKIENLFDKFVNMALKIYGNAFTFIVAVIFVIVFLSNQVFRRQNLHDILRDIIMCVTFLSFFIIQKAFNKYSAAIHLKMNELVASHDNASNELLNVELKPESELKELAKNYDSNKENKNLPGTTGTQ